MSAIVDSHHRVWRDMRACTVLGMGHALPGAALHTAELLARMHERFGIDVKHRGAAAARLLGVQSRHVCRDLLARHEAPRAGDSNAELAARALQAALNQAGLQSNDLAYLIGHTASPEKALPPNISHVAELIGYDGPFLELRQACTGFANALIMARGLLETPGCGPIAIVGSETGSVFFDPLRAAEDEGQLINLVQMGDGAAACVLGSDAQPGAGRLSHFYFGQIGRDRHSGFTLTQGSFDHAAARHRAPEFAHDFVAVRRYGPELFEHGVAAAQAMGIELCDVDYVIPHQANGRMAELLSPHLGIEAQRIFVNADQLGNTGSAAIWLALHALRSRLRAGERVLILGAEATKHMFGGMLYVHA
jgi:3-oxoacyl-[acyl-carrier-protein] synthase III